MSPSAPGAQSRLAVLALACLALPPSLLLAAPLEKLTIERINSEPSLSGTLPSRFQWHPDGKRLTFLRRAGETTSLFALDVTKGAETLLLDGAKLLLPGEKPGPLPLASASWLPDGQTLLVPAQGDVFTVDVRTGGRRGRWCRRRRRRSTPRLRPTAAGWPSSAAATSSSSTWRPAGKPGSPQGGSETLLNGKLDWVYEEELASRSGQAFVWSPDSKAIAYLQLDQTRVPTFPIVDFLPVRNEVEWQRYPKAGAPNAIVRLGVVGLDKDGTPGPAAALVVRPRRRLRPAPARLDARLAPRRLPAPEPRPERAGAAPAARARSAREPLGTPRTVLTERSKAWVNTFGPPRFLKDGRRFLWLSERDGFAHVYPCDLAGRAGPSPRARGWWTAACRSPGPDPASYSTSAAASCTSPPPRRTRASATSTAPASTAPAAPDSRARTACTAPSSRPTAASTPTPGPTCARPRAPG